MKNITKYENDYTSLPFEEQQVYYRKKKEIESISKYPHRSILEIGCGLMPLYRNFNDFNNLTIIEPSKHFFEQALLDAPKNVKIVHAFFENISEDLISLAPDVILVSGLLHELPNITEFLSSLQSVAQPHSIIHINTPNAKSFHRLLAKEMGLVSTIYDLSDQNQKLQQEHVFCLDSLTKLLITHNFEIIEYGSFLIKPFTHFQMQELLNQGTITKTTLTGLNKMTKYFPDNGSEIFMNVRKAKN